VSRIFLASRNRKKIVEMERLLREYAPDVEVLGIDDVEGYDEPVEDQPTFEGNALLKARAGLENTGLPSLADDSGLCVDALNGMPGVLSARWAGPPPAGQKEQADAKNNELLLAQLSDVPDERRGAHFACAVALVHEGGAEVVHGRMSGHVIREQRGSGGFGYDVLFVADEHADAGLTSAELSPEQKDAVSHRGRALREIAPRVARVLGA
jgi:XTP/dITP diphosphohydrolase